jgi:GR25 family glycosyltransferase involved in LPS biosynthesis/tetratricopeptide (TPR) repeat protein
VEAAVRIRRDRPTICLSMIVRDESHVVRETLDSVAPYIDCWVVVDTGSVDGTMAAVREHMDERGIPGELHQRPWQDFGRNRTEALELCRGKADYAWVVDADDLVVGGLDLSALVADSYLLRYGDDFRYWRKQIFRDGLRWRFEGAVHEYPRCLDPASEARLAGDYHLVSRRLGARSRDPRKYERDSLLLERELERNPDDARSVFYLAQSRFDAGDHQAALESYTQRARMGGWNEEVFYSLLQRGRCLELLGEPWGLALEAHLEAWQARPTRAEPLHEISRHYRMSEEFELGYMFAERACAIPFPEEDSLFVAADVYLWRARDEKAVCAHHAGRPEEAFEISTELLEGTALPDSERERVRGNRDLSVRAIEPTRAGYPGDIVSEVAARAAERSGEPAAVTATITSCRRPALFERTVNSFLNCCTDLERIDRWICVDNGSTEADRARMRELYPFFEFIHTDPERGERHPDSMNRILELVESPWWLHLEDDWQFFWRGPYVGRSLEILRDDESLSQVAFNPNYGETLESRQVTGGEARRTTHEDTPYLVHEFLDPDTEPWRRHLEAMPPGSRTVAYWPHFTLRPSVIRLDAVAAVGDFDTDGSHFELSFAKRYAAAGNRTAFFDQITCLHTGRLTGGAGDSERVSAYQLVGDGTHPAAQGGPTGDGERADGTEVAVINLDRRPDRWDRFRSMARRTAGPDFVDRCRRVTAVDGMALSATPELEHLFRGNDFRLRRGIVGCALSHIGVWRSLAGAGGDQDIRLILEDDAELVDGFDRQLANVCELLRREHPTFEVALLGHLTSESLLNGLDPEATAGLRPMRWDGFIGGLSTYVVSRRGARHLLELIDRDGIQNGIDTFVMLKGEELVVLECDPSIASTSMAHSGNAVDSDIQRDFEPIGPGAQTDAERARPRALSELAPSCGVAELRLDLESGRRCTAASVSAGAGGFRITVRTLPENSVESLAEAVDYVVTLDDQLEPREVEGLTPGDEVAEPSPGEVALNSAPDGTPGDGWLAIAGGSAAQGSGTAHHLVHLDLERNPVAVSESFVLTGRGDELRPGLAERDGQLVISFVTSDGRAMIAALELEDAMASLTPCP